MKNSAMQLRPANQNFYFDYQIEHETLCLHIDFESDSKVCEHLIICKTFDITVKRLAKTDPFKAHKILCDFTRYLRKNNLKKRLFKINNF